MTTWECPECGYRYDERRGDPEEGYAPGTRLKDLPNDFACPDCSVRFRDDFRLSDERV